MHEEIADSGLVSDDDNNEPARMPTLVAVVDVVNTCSFVECGSPNYEMLSVLSRLKNMALGAANYCTKQSNITDYFK